MDFLPHLLTQSLLLLIICPRLCILSPCPNYSPLLNGRYPSSSYNLVSWNSPAHRLCGPQFTSQVWKAFCQSRGVTARWNRPAGPEVCLAVCHRKSYIFTINRLHWLSTFPLPCSGKDTRMSLNHMVLHNQGLADRTKPQPLFISLDSIHPVSD